MTSTTSAITYTWTPIRAKRIIGSMVMSVGDPVAFQLNPVVKNVMAQLIADKAGVAASIVEVTITAVPGARRLPFDRSSSRGLQGGSVKVDYTFVANDGAAAENLALTMGSNSTDVVGEQLTNNLKAVGVDASVVVDEIVDAVAEDITLTATTDTTT